MHKTSQEKVAHVSTITKDQHNRARIWFTKPRIKEVHSKGTPDSTQDEHDCAEQEQ